MKKLALLAAIVALSVLAGEMIARTLLWQPAPEADVGRIRFGYSAAGLGDNHPDQDGVYITAAMHRYRPFYVRTNGEGLRNRRELDPDAYRILALGDSQTFGLFVNSQDVWTDWLEFRLNRDGRRVQVLNNGLPGSTIIEQLEFFEEKGRHLAPRMVILCVFANDIGDMRRSVSSRAEGLALDRAVRFSDLRWFLGHHSALYDAARQVKAWAGQEATRAANQRMVAEAGGGGGGPVLDPVIAAGQDEEMKARYARGFEAFVAAVRRSGAEPVVAYLPAMDERKDGERESFVAGLAERHGTRFVSLHQAVNSRPLDEVWLARTGDSDYPADGHLSRTGHMLVAGALAEALSF